MRKTLACLLAATSLTPAALFADSLTRVATVQLGAEITGIYEQGPDLFFNTQHPEKDLQGPFSKASVGVISNVNWQAANLPAPIAAADKARVVSTLGDYQILMQEGDDGIVGIIKTIAGKDLISSNDPDFNGFVPTGESSGLLFTNWENRPGGMSRAALTRSPDGTWSVGDVSMIDFSGVRGTWVNCFGTMSPWKTPLSSEELYFDNSSDWNNPGYKYHDGQQDLATYLGSYPNPYDYGYIVEITDPVGAAAPVKHFALGRFSHENAVVMPDNRTVYLSDDGTGVVFFKFIADVAGDLSAGTLYAAKATQQVDGNAADSATTGFDIEWIELAHGTNEKIEDWIRAYDGISPADFVEGQNSYITEADVAAWADGKADDDRVAFLESRKAAAAKGATAEFRKMEGVNINYDGAKDGSVPYMYVAMSSIGKTMADGEGDVRLEANKCGVVYEMKLDADFDVASMVPVVAGHGYNKDNAPNACPVSSISNPDNLIVRKDGSVVIGEDTGNHENNAMWVWTRGQG
ncbi:alkaline phosphatase PhoX [Aliiroseovarius sp. 2305UL8-7]|uniref:alkaline phosphatase PhoX n=1 Tax=Aliiroseovarius conchicola TaxID=3121637 RepID=UPI003527D1BE